ncbi:MAG: hypothetical protein KAR38_10410, partial [Calditrichia bacterium]|nr:hypothetical protein [Calditrichia bacterium]
PSVSLAYSNSKNVQGMSFNASIYGNFHRNQVFKLYPEIGVSFTQIMAKHHRALSGDGTSKDLYFTLNGAIKIGSIAHLLIAPGMSLNKDSSTAFISIGILFSEQ